MMIKFPYTLEIGTVFTIRSINAPLASMIENVNSSRTPSGAVKATINICTGVNQLSTSAILCKLVNLYSGDHNQIVDKYSWPTGRYIDGSISPGLATFVSDPYKKYVRIYLNSFMSYEESPDHDQLAIARDMLFENKDKDARPLLKQIIPFGWPLFMAIVNFEKKKLSK